MVLTEAPADLLQGTLDMLILQSLALRPMHGYGISKRLEEVTKGVFKVNPGSFFPALYRLENEGLIRGQWGRSENNRRAKYYRLTSSGHRRLESAKSEWNRVSLAIRAVLEAS